MILFNNFHTLLFSPLKRIAKSSSLSSSRSRSVLADDSAKTDRGEDPLKKADQNDLALIGGIDPYDIVLWEKLFKIMPRNDK